MSVYKHRNSPFWQFDFQLSGYRFSGSTEIPHSRPKREAEAVETTERRAAERLTETIRVSGRKPLTLGAACDRWWAEVGKYGTEIDLEKAVIWLAGKIGRNRPLHTITGDDISTAIAERRTHTKKDGRDELGRQLYRPIGPRAVNRTVTLLLRRVMRRAAQHWGAVILNEPKWAGFLLPVPKRPIRELSTGEEAAIASVEGSYGSIRRVATLLGLRKRECILTWPQIDFENAVVRIMGKGGIPRIVPMSREAYEILWGERGRHPLYVFTYVAERTQKARKGLTHATIKGERCPVTYSGLTTHQRRRWRRAGVDARFHDLRHTAGMRTLRATGNLKVTQRLLGHSDIGTTARFYTDALVEDVRSAMETTAAAVEKSRNEARKEPETQAKMLKPRT